MNNLITSTEELKDILDDPHLIILDCSAPSNQAGLKSNCSNLKIKNSRYFDLKNDFSNQESEFPNMLPTVEQFEMACRKMGISNHNQIVIYDNLGIYTSPRVWWMFKVMGHNNVTVLNGGLPEWVNSNYPLQNDYDINYEKGDFKCNFQENLIATFHKIENNREKENALVIDARKTERFNGIEKETRKNLRSGNIPSSINIPFNEVLNNGKFKNKAALKLVFQNLENESKELIFSCGSGVTACIVYMASEFILNNPKSLYDGSWTEYGTLVTS
ncbi:sulfurtransferase [Zunongwangia pacifica]|uniref:Sulfurtransferase n=1 Tax=Zunongwangia pacifica TaxID=2911062 RepID=A0A9X2CQP6_9FLAO|nr:sulfurtransferase [Zunongwangia pacifica]MCL6220158.1 sulfurtransferase [Zunongwangia pacifica]